MAIAATNVIAARTVPNASSVRHGLWLRLVAAAVAEVFDAPAEARSACRVLGLVIVMVMTTRLLSSLR